MKQEPINEQARHTRGAYRTTPQIAWDFIRKFKWIYLPMLLSRYGREVVRRKYDAIATDLAYENHCSWELGPVSYVADKFVLSLPTHGALRQRLRFVADGLKLATTEVGTASDSKPVRILSAPCGAGRDLAIFGSEIAAESPELFSLLEVHALDLDPTGEALPLLKQRATAAGMDVTVHQQDLFTLKTDNADGISSFDIVNSIGLTPWLTLEDVSALVTLFHNDLMADSGYLLIDLFKWHRFSRLAYSLEINTIYHEHDEFISTVERAGFRLLHESEASNKVNTLFTFRKGE